MVAAVWSAAALPLRGQAVVTGSPAREPGPVESPAALSRRPSGIAEGAWPASTVQRVLGPSFRAPADSVGTRRAPWWAPVASALLPGAGQFALGQQRSVGYVVAEAYLLLQVLGARRDGDRQRDAYRELAASVARRRFGAQPAVGSWDYYESMEKFLESGGYDRIPGGVVDPELDESTFNGARWLLARQIYWRDPRVAPAATSQEYQRAVTLTGVVWMNHLASLIDAYVSWRIRRFGGAGVAGLTVESVRFEALPQATHLGGGLVFGGHVRLVPGQGGR